MTGTEAAWWKTIEGGDVRCTLCPIGCRLKEGRDGPCGTRGNRDGRMVALQYGRIVAAGVDPIEKKPLYHFHPGAPIFSVAAPGCNLHCLFCQNWNISQQTGGPTREASPREIVDLALDQGSLGIAYTYSEPLVWFEFVRDTAALAREAGLLNVVVTNGFLEPGPLAELLPLLDAANVDLKSMDDDFYRKICKARLGPVLDAIRSMRAAGIHLEITNLLIPGHNDRDDQIGELVEFVAGLGRDVPLHFSAYRPAWKLEAPPTPRSTMQRALGLGRERLDYVYAGNVSLPGGGDTICPGCGRTVVSRDGFAVSNDLGPQGVCPGCGMGLPFRI